MTDLKINDVRPRVYLEQTLAGAKIFDLPFPVVEAGDVKASVDGMPVPPEDFSVTKLGETDGARITFSDPPEVGARIAIWRDMPVERTADFLEDGAFRASSVNAELDRMAMLLQQIEAMLGDTIRRPVADADIDMRLPSRDVRAGTFLSFDAEGYPETVEKRESLNTVAENLTDIRNFADTYLGPQTSNPSTRSDGSALHDGDFYFNTADSRLRIYSSTSGSWVTGHAPVGDFLPRDGSLAMTGPLEAPAMTVDGNTVWHAGNDGPGSGLDADRLTGLESTDLARVADLQDAQARLAAAENQLALNTLRDLTAAGWSMSNMIDGFADSFEDQVGQDVSRPVIDQATLNSESTYSDHVIENLRDGDGATSWSSTTSNTTWCQADFGVPAPLALFTMMADISSPDRTPSDFTLLGSDTGAFSGEETTLLTISGEPAWVALESRSWTFQITGIFRYYRINILNKIGTFGKAAEYQIAAMEFHTEALSENAVYLANGQTYTNLHLPTVAAFEWTDGQGGNGFIVGNGTLNYNGSSGGAVRSLVAHAGDFQFDATCSNDPSTYNANDRLGIYANAENTGFVDNTTGGTETMIDSFALEPGTGDVLYGGSTVKPGASPLGFGDIISFRRSSSAITIHVNGVLYHSFSTPFSGNFRLFVGSNSQTADYHDVRFGVGVRATTLLSEPQIADTVSTDARVLLLAEPVGTITLNTDLIAEVSRDDGTSWTAGTLVNAAHYEATTNIYVTDDIDLTAQPEGSVMRLRVRTTNAKEIRVHGWTLQWR